MNDDRTFQSHREVFVALLKIKLPRELAAKYLGAHPATGYNYFANLQKEGWAKKAILLSKSRKPMLILYAKLTQSEIKIDKCISTEKLQVVLKDFLEVDKIVEILNCSCKFFLPLTKISFSENVPAAYRSIVLDIFDEQEYASDNGLYYWLRYLRRINSLEIYPPAKTSDIINLILKEYSDEIRERLTPTITEEVCQLIDERIIPLFDGEKLKVVRLYYGFDGPAKSSKEVGKELNVSHARINQHQQVIRRTLHYNRRLIYGNYLSWKYLVNQIEESVNKEAAKWQEDLNECYRIIEHFGEAPKLNKNKHSVAAFDISVRLKGVLRSKGIVYFEDLKEVPEQDLLKIRNCGAGTLQELKEIMDNLGIEFKK